MPNCPVPPPSRPAARPTRRPLVSSGGPYLLQRYVDRECGGVISDFADRAKLSPSFCSRLLAGKRGSALSVEVAKAIESATGGAVPWYAWTESHLPPGEAGAAEES